MAVKLSEGSLEVIMSGGKVDCPVMQILGCKKLAGSNSQERYRLLISDGKHLNSFAMIATQLNDLVTSGQLCDFTVVKIIRSICSTVNSNAEKERRVMVILELEVVKKGTEVGIRLGNPVQFDGSSSTQSNGTANHTPLSSVQPTAPVSAAPPKLAVNSVRLSSPSQNAPIHPISSLNPYQNKWCIKAKVINKQPIRTYTNARGEGKLFSVTFADETGEIKCTGFNTACDKFADILEINKVYLVSNCSLKAANKRYTSADYEMTFNDDSMVMPSNDDSGFSINLFNFVPISKLSEMGEGNLVDVIGVAKETQEVQTFTARTTGKELKKREITLVDESNTAISCTLWGEQAVNFDGSGQPIVACKGVKIGDFMGGRSVSVLMSSLVQINPDIPEAHRLRGWYDDGGSTQSATSLSTKTSSAGGTSNWILLGDVTSRGLGMGDKADYFDGFVNILMAKSENAVYKACAGQDCKKKVMDMNNGTYRCEKCNRDYESFVYRILLSLQVNDYSGAMWVSAFNEDAQKILNCTADEIGQALECHDDSYKEYFTRIAFRKIHARFRAKMETYNDESRLKSTIVSVDPVDHKAYARRMLTAYKQEHGLSTSR